MMFADLVDVDDFRQRLGELGIDLPAGGSPDSWAARVRAAQPVDGLPELIAMLCADAVTLQPEVRQVIDIIMMR